MCAKSSEFYNAIPVAIRPVIIRRDMLPSEDPKVYDGLLIELWKLFRPKDVLQWLDLKKLHDLTWEQLRYSRLKSSIIESAQKKALSHLLLSMTLLVNKGWKSWRKVFLTETR